jgi:peptidyl-prolyl isomerase E (cyclophilin E)
LPTTWANAFVEPAKHRGFAFVTFSSAEDAQDAIDNMDMNELSGRVLKVSLARPMKTPAQLGGNRAGTEISI